METRRKTRSATSNVEINSDKKRIIKPNTPIEPRRIMTKRTAVKEIHDDTKSNQAISPIPSVRNGVKKPKTTLSTSNIPYVQSFWNALEQVLSMKHADVTERLKITFPAKCIQSLKKCDKEHARNDVS